MCILLIAHQMTEQRPLLILANRDEFYDRPTAAADKWVDVPGLIGGRDLVSGGSWFGARGARWASVTNIREGISRGREHHSRSRGWLVRDYLTGNLGPSDFLAGIEPHKDDYAGYNLLLGDAGIIFYSSNRDGATRSLEPGIYGLSNHLLDTPWPKVVRAKKAFKDLLNKPGFNHSKAFALLADTVQAEDAELPDTGIPLAWERALSAIFITTADYGTRCSTLLQADARGQRLFVERRFTEGPREWQESLFSW